LDFRHACSGFNSRELCVYLESVETSFLLVPPP
jgi:hypothetical protein